MKTSLETRKVRRGSIPYLKDAKRRGHRAFEEGQADSEWLNI
jgi:hypothetical protein